MTNWFDLPAEVRQHILCYALDVSEIVYSPRDHRQTAAKHQAIPNFHNLLCVSKAFLSQDDLVTAIVRKATLNVYKKNQLIRLTSELNTAVRQGILKIHLSRNIYPTGDRSSRGSFDDFGNLEQCLNGLPNLQEIKVSWPEYCASIGQYKFRTWEDIRDELQDCSTHDNLDSSFWRPILLAAQQCPPDQVKTPLRCQPDTSTIHGERLYHILLSFLGDRRNCFLCDRRDQPPRRPYKRPHSWLRKLTIWAETTETPVYFMVNLCLGLVTNHSSIVPLGVPMPRPLSLCPNRNFRYFSLHRAAVISTKDYILRMTLNLSGLEKEWSFDQRLAREWTQIPQNASARRFVELLEPLPRQNLSYLKTYGFPF